PTRSRRPRAADCWLAAWIVSSGDLAASSRDLESAMSLYTPSSCAAYPLTVSTRFGIRSLRRCSWFSTCAHWALIASSCPTNLLYEQPPSGSPTSASTRSRSPVLRVICISPYRVSSLYQSYQLDLPTPPP